jgi:hypothetical protein
MRREDRFYEIAALFRTASSRGGDLIRARKALQLLTVELRLRKAGGVEIQELLSSFYVWNAGCLYMLCY